MDGENNGKPYFLLDDLGWKPNILRNPPCLLGGSSRFPWLITMVIVFLPRKHRGLCCGTPSKRPDFMGYIRRRSDYHWTIHWDDPNFINPSPTQPTKWAKKHSYKWSEIAPCKWLKKNTPWNLTTNAPKDDGETNKNLRTSKGVSGAFADGFVSLGGPPTQVTTTGHRQATNLPSHPSPVSEAHCHGDTGPMSHSPRGMTYPPQPTPRKKAGYQTRIS